MKSGAIESSRRKEQEERRPEQREFKETECSEVRHRLHRTDISRGTGCIESRRSTVVKHETSVPATRQKKERTKDQKHFHTYDQIKDSGVIQKEDKEKEKSGQQDLPPKKVSPKKRQVVEKKRAELAVAIPLAPARKVSMPNVFCLRCSLVAGDQLFLRRGMLEKNF